MNKTYAEDLSKLTDAQIDARLAALLRVKATRKHTLAPVASRKQQITSTPSAASEPAPKSPQAQSLFIRSDPLDGFAYIYPFEPQDGKGASISVSKNNIANSMSVMGSGFVSYVIDRYALSNNGVVAYAPFVYANGSYANPFKNTERNAIQSGLDFQYGLPTFDRLGLRPYFQTDYRGDARIYGASLVYENPYINALLTLGRPINTTTDNTPQIFRTWWRFIPEFNYIHVDVPGRTSFAKDDDYAFFGGTVQARTTFLNNIGPPAISGRIYLDGSVTVFGDLLDSGRAFHDSQIELGYIISKDKPIDPSALTTSVSLVYNNGQNRYTFERRDQYKVQLNVQY